MWGGSSWKEATISWSHDGKSLNTFFHLHHRLWLETVQASAKVGLSCALFPNWSFYWWICVRWMDKCHIHFSLAGHFIFFCLTTIKSWRVQKNRNADTNLSLQAPAGFFFRDGEILVMLVAGTWMFVCKVNISAKKLIIYSPKQSYPNAVWPINKSGICFTIACLSVRVSAPSASWVLNLLMTVIYVNRDASY